MTEDQIREAAAIRCAFISNKYPGWGQAEFSKTDFETERLIGARGAAMYLATELHKLSYMVDELYSKVHNMDDRVRFPDMRKMRDAARQHILPKPVLTAAERLAKELGVGVGVMESALKDLGIVIVYPGPPAI